MIHIRKLILLLLLASWCHVCTGQINARISFYDSYFPAEGVEAVSFAVGLMYEPTPRLHLSLDYKSDANTIFKVPINKYINQMQNGALYRYISTYYTFKELSYKSGFSFRDNDENSGYVASGIALRLNGWQSEYTNYGSTTGSITTKKYTKVTVPLSIYIGHKRKNDGFFTDFFFGINYNIGTAKGWDNEEATAIDFPNNLNKIGFRYGLTFNINLTPKKSKLSY